jgi:proline iminopeptidase
MRTIIIAVVLIALIAIIVFSFFLIFNSGQTPEQAEAKSDEDADAQAFFTPPPQAGVKPGFWRVQNEVELFYFSDGSGTPVLVLHGGPGFPSSEPWKGLSLLNKNFKFYYYHQRGCGKSSRPFDRFTSGDFNRNMQALINALGIEQQIADIERIRRLLGQEKIILIGHSFGGFTAALYAAKFPDRVKKLALFAPADIFKMPPSDGGLYERIKKALPQGKMQKDYDDYLRRFFDYGNIFSRNERELAELNSEFGKYYAAALKNRGLPFTETSVSLEDAGGWLTPAIFFSLGQSYDRTKELEAIICPTLVVYADQDLVLSPRDMKTYADNIRNCQVQVVAGAGHHFFNDKPEEVAKILTGFLK